MTGRSAESAMPATKVPFNIALLHPRYLGSWLILLFAAVLSVFPQSVRHWLGRLVGANLYSKNKKRRNIVQANLRQVFPELSEEKLQDMVRGHLNWHGKALVDYSLFFFGSKRRLAKQVAIVNEELLAQLKQAEQPVILLLAHSVMLEFAVIAVSSAHYKSFGSYKASSNPVLDWIIARSRCRFADFVVSRDAGLRPLIRAIKSQRIMIFLPDEDLGLDNATFAPFYGRLKATLTTPARLSKLGGAKAVVGFVAFDEASKHYQLHLQEMPAAYPKGDAFGDAVALNEMLEKLISKSPEQYMWTMKWFRTIAPQDGKFY